MNTGLENPPWLTSESYRLIIKNSTNIALSTLRWKAYETFEGSALNFSFILRGIPWLHQHCNAAQQPHILQVLHHQEQMLAKQHRLDLKHYYYYYSLNLISCMQTTKGGIQNLSTLTGNLLCWTLFLAESLDYTFSKGPFPKVLSNLSFSAILWWDSDWSLTKKSAVCFLNHNSRLFRLLLRKLRQEWSSKDLK